MSNKKSKLSEVSNVSLLMRHGILSQIIKENPDDPRVSEPKRQLSIILAEIKSRGIEQNEDGSFNLTRKEVDAEIKKTKEDAEQSYQESKVPPAQIITLDPLSLSGKTQLNN